MKNILEKIYKVGLKFLVPLTLEETYKLIVEEALKLIGANYGSILLGQQAELKRVYSSSPVLYKIKPRRRGWMYTVYTTKKPLILSSKSIIEIHPEIKQLGLRSDIIVPLSYRNHTIGVLSMMSYKDQYFTEQEVRILELFAPLASLAIKKSQLQDETKKALEFRDLFISMAAHELRTPITTISGYSQLLYSKFAGANTPEARWIEDLSLETLRLTYLVNELLEVNRIKTGQFEYIWKECSLRKVIKRAMSDSHFTHPKHKIIFQDNIVGDKDIIIGDFNKLLQLVINLLDNAAKFSPLETEIIVELKSKARLCYLSVMDRGKGIPKKDIHRVFEKFYQGTDHSKEGLGVGLFLVKNIVKQHHGDITIRSKEKIGTSIEIKLPRIVYV